MTAISRKGRSQNRQLYRDGERYLRKLPPTAHGNYTTNELDPIAEGHATSVAEVRTAVEFVDAVNQIAISAGESAKKLLLSGKNVRLTPVLIRNLRRCTPLRIRAAMFQAANGLHPLGRPVPAGTLPELAMWDYDLYRLRLASNLLDASKSERPAQSLSLTGKPPSSTALLYWNSLAQPSVAAGFSLRMAMWAPASHSAG